MSNYAKIIDGIVVEVLVAEQDVIDSGLFGNPAEFIQTSYNTRGGIHYGQDGNPDGGIALRKNYAGVGDIYDIQRDAFISKKPYNSWNLNEETCLWQAPVPCPVDGKLYNWDESTQSWLEI